MKQEDQEAARRISEDDLSTFEGWLRYQGFDAATLAPDELADWCDICRRTPASGGARTMLRCVRQQPARGRLFDAPLPSAHDEAARAHFAPLPELFRRRASE